MQESIGDALFLGFMAPQNLNRLRLLPDEFLFTNPSKQFQTKSSVKHNNECANKPSIQKLTALGKEYPNFSCKNQHSFTFDSHFNEFDLSLLLKMALTKIPQIPFEYILDIFRWDLFSGNITMANANEHFWRLAVTEQGIHPPDWENRSNFFDAGAKYHVADNTPFVR